MATAATGRSRPVTPASGPSFVKPIDNIGTKTLPNYAGYAQRHVYSINVPGCSTPGRVFVGQRAEAFAVNLGGVFDLVNFVPVEGDSAPGAGDGKGFPGGITQSRANDDVVGESNVTSLALELPISCVVGKGNGVIGAWTSASLPRRSALDPSPTLQRHQRNQRPAGAGLAAVGAAWSTSW